MMARTLSWPCGLMDKELAVGRNACRSESCPSHAKLASAPENPGPGCSQAGGGRGPQGRGVASSQARVAALLLGLPRGSGPPPIFPRPTGKAQALLG